LRKARLFPALGTAQITTCNNLANGGANADGAVGLKHALVLLELESQVNHITLAGKVSSVEKTFFESLGSLGDWLRYVIVAPRPNRKDLSKFAEGNSIYRKNRQG